MQNELKQILFTLNAIKRFAILALTIHLFGCSSGGSGGDDTKPNQPVIPEDVTQTGSEMEGETETESAALLIDQPALNWTSCENKPALECASLLVPLDYLNPQGKTIKIAIARTLANQTMGSRTLIMNPGGPGASGIKVLDTILRFNRVSNSMKDAFNFVSFDPRGTGDSDSVRCTTPDTLASNRYQTNLPEIESGFNDTVRLAQDCAESHGEFLQHLGSHNVVRDIDEIRKALELTEIDFLGFSYGTRLAALYLQTYPEHTGRFVLDGSVSPMSDVTTLVRGFVPTGQANISKIANACSVNDVIDCNPEEFEADLRRRMEELAASDPASQETEMLYYILLFAFSTPSAAEFLNLELSSYLETQNIGLLQSLYSELGFDEVTVENDVVNRTAYTAVFCADDPARPTVDTLNALRIELNAQSDLLAELMIYPANICAGWPEALNPLPPIVTNQAPVSLVIGGPSDAQTPLVYSQQMAAAIGGQFLRSEHEGHITVFSSRNDCTDTVVETFFLTGNLPTTSVCEANKMTSRVIDRRLGMPLLMH